MTELTKEQASDHPTYFDRGFLTGFAVVCELIEQEKFTTLPELYRYLMRRCKGDV